MCSSDLVTGNKQMRTYALGALLAHPGKAVDTITVTIVQPRANHPDGIIRSETFDVVERIHAAGYPFVFGVLLRLVHVLAAGDVVARAFDAVLAAREAQLADRSRMHRTWSAPETLDHFAAIVPCGIQEFGVTSLADLGIAASLAGASEAHAFDIDEEQLLRSAERGVGLEPEPELSESVPADVCLAVAVPVVV